jgi:subtilisin family serine protease
VLGILLALSVVSVRDALAAPPQQPNQGDPQATAPMIYYVKGRILVQPRAGLSDKELDKALQPHGGHRGFHIKQINVHVIELPSTANVIAVVDALNANPHIKFAEIDQVFEPGLFVNDPSVSSEWHLTKIGASSAWDSGTGAGVKIAIIDTGVDATHPDLAAAIVPGWNFYDNNSDTRDLCDHGTNVAGAAAAIGNNAVGVAGVAFSAKIIPIKVVDSTCSTSSSLLAQGLTYAADNGARVANMSFMVAGSATVQSGAQYLRNKGGVAVSSGGNAGGFWNIANTSAITEVAATDSTDTRPSWSSYGPYIDVAAPGVGILTTKAGGGYESVSGTSLSAPVTAGTYALMISVNPKLAPSTLDQALYSTAVDLGASGYDQYYGWGRINAAAAVALAKTTVATDTTSPTASITSPIASSTVSGLVPINVSATDNIGVTRVDLLVNGALYATDTTAPYAFSWDTSALPDGSNTLQATAYDAAGNQGNSSKITVTVANDTIPPKVTISSPVSGAVVSGSVAISVSATDNNKVSQISLTIDGKQVALSYGSQLSYTWSVTTTATSSPAKSKAKHNATTIQSGTSHTITATALDPAGNKGTASVSVTVQ